MYNRNRRSKGFNQKRGHGRHGYHDNSQHNGHVHSEYQNGDHHHSHYNPQQQQHQQPLHHKHHQQNHQTQQQASHSQSREEYNPYIHSNGIMSDQQLHHVQHEMHSATQPQHTHTNGNPYVDHGLTSAMSHYSPTKNAQFVQYYHHHPQQQHRTQIGNEELLAGMRRHEDQRYTNGHHAAQHNHHGDDADYSSLAHRIETNFSLQVEAGKQRKVEHIRDKHKAKQQRAQQRAPQAQSHDDATMMMNSMGAIVESQDNDLNLDAVHAEYEQFLTTVHPNQQQQHDDDDQAEGELSMESPARSDSNVSDDKESSSTSDAYRVVRQHQERDSNVNIHDMDDSGQPRITPRNAKTLLRVDDHVWMMDREKNAWTVYTVKHVDCMLGADENDNEHILFTLQYGAKTIKMWGVQFETEKVFKMVGKQTDDDGGGGDSGDGSTAAASAEIHEEDMQYVVNDIIRSKEENVMYRIQTFDANTFDADILRLSNSQIQKVNLKEFAHTKWS